MTRRVKNINRKRKNNARKFKTVQDGGLIKKHHEVNMNVEQKQYTKEKGQGREERVT